MLVFIPKLVRPIAASLLFLFLSSCGSSIASRPDSPPENNYGATQGTLKFFDQEQYTTVILSHISDGKNQLLIDFTKQDKKTKETVGRFLILSADAGKTFSAEVEISSIFGELNSASTAEYRFADSSVLAVFHKSHELFYTKSTKALSGWSKPSKITDSHSAGPTVSFVNFDESRIAVAWPDGRESETKIYSSYSVDGGKTWSLNAPVDGALIGRRQEQVHLAMGANSRLFAVWLDWRDAKTLADIRSARSDDLGKTWTSSQKVNDDELPVWQLAPSIIADKETVVIAFGDFRENGPDEDRDWNIYIARSEDNGESWAPNKRLNNETAGRQTSPFLSRSASGQFFAVFASTENTIFGQKMLARSLDNGKTWSDAAALTEIDELPNEGVHDQVAFGDGRVALRLRNGQSTDKSSRIVIAAPNASPTDSKTDHQSSFPKPVVYREGNIVFEDDFEGNIATQWKVRKGAWEIIDGTYSGLNILARGYDRHDRYLSFARVAEPVMYRLKGKFKLDEISHVSALICFRSGPDDELVITNQFRHGSWLAVQDSNQADQSNLISVGDWSQKHLAQKRFSFRAGIWYKFEVIVTDEQIDYRVDGKLMFTHRLKQKLPPGKFGLGGHWRSPSYFDDIVVNEIEK